MVEGLSSRMRRLLGGPKTAPRAGVYRRSAASERVNTGQWMSKGGDGTGAVPRDLVVPCIPKSEETRAMIRASMRCCSGLFAMLDDATRDNIINTMEHAQYSTGAVVLKQGDKDAERFFVIESGCCEVYQQQQNSAATPQTGHGRKLEVTYGPGGSFGELALLHSVPRAATVSTTEPTSVWIMERKYYTYFKRQYFKTIYKEKMDLLDMVPSFKILNPRQMDLLVDAMESVSFAADHAIIKQGDKGDEFFVISEGQVSIRKDGQVVNTLEAGAFFGERSLIRDDVRAADVIALGAVKCMKLNRKAFVAILGPLESLWRLAHLQRIPLFSNLKEEQLLQLATSLEVVQLKSEQVVCRQGEVGNKMYIVSEGTLNVKSAEGTKQLGQGAYFGERSMLEIDCRTADISCATDCELLCLTQSMLIKTLGELNALLMSWREEVLGRVPIFQALSKAQRQELARSLTSALFHPGDTIMTRGESGDTFYLIESGEVKVLGGDDGETVVATLKASDFFGERALINNEVRNATVQASGRVQLLVMARKAFRDMLGSAKGIFEQALKERENKAAALKVDVKDLQTIATLGVGAFGKVTLVKHRQALYALKSIGKAHVVSTNMLRHITREREAMKQLSSPFTVNLVATFQDRDNVYMLLERVMGGEFFSLLHNLDQAPSEKHVRFYAACVIEGLGHIHKRGYMFRDLKPENLLLDTSGYLKITDFGFAKSLDKGKSFTMCGTPDYLAPELLEQSGHNQAVDWWAMGVLIYEMCTLCTPFASDDDMQRYRNIQSVSVDWTTAAGLSAECKNLIKLFLVKNPALRLGSGANGLAKIKAHAWFRGFDWAALESRTMKAPYVPPLKSSTDMCMFEPVDEDIDCVPGQDEEYSKDTMRIVEDPATWDNW